MLVPEKTSYPCEVQRTLPAHMYIYTYMYMYVKQLKQRYKVLEVGPYASCLYFRVRMPARLVLCICASATGRLALNTGACRHDQQDGLRICVGQRLLDKLASLSVFMVGVLCYFYFLSSYKSVDSWLSSRMVR